MIRDTTVPMSVKTEDTMEVKWAICLNRRWEFWLQCMDEMDLCLAKGVVLGYTSDISHETTKESEND